MRNSGSYAIEWGQGPEEEGRESVPSGIWSTGWVIQGLVEIFLWGRDLKLEHKWDTVG